MGAYALRRILLAVPTLLGVVTLVFALLHMIPGDPVDAMLGESAAAADRTVLRAELGLDRPILIQYGQYLVRVLRGDLGRSLHSGQPVRRLIAARYPTTAKLAVVALVIAVAIAVPTGIASAAFPGSAFDIGGRVVAVVGAAVPNFVLGPLLVLLVAIDLEWLPVSGHEGLSHLWLPALTLGLGMAGLLTRLLRTTMLERLGDDYIRTARAKGGGELRVLLRHALRNAVPPVLTVIGLQAGALLAGAIITETIFAWPGIGRLTVLGIQTRDYPVVQGCVLVIASSYVVLNLLTDLIYGAVDPRRRPEQ